MGHDVDPPCGPACLEPLARAQVAHRNDASRLEPLAHSLRLGRLQVKWDLDAVPDDRDAGLGTKTVDEEPLGRRCWAASREIP
jgi:hypothetical protein